MSYMTASACSLVDNGRLRPKGEAGFDAPLSASHVEEGLGGSQAYRFSPPFHAGVRHTKSWLNQAG